MRQRCKTVSRNQILGVTTTLVGKMCHLLRYEILVSDTHAFFTLNPPTNNWTRKYLLVFWLQQFSHDNGKSKRKKRTFCMYLTNLFTMVLSAFDQTNVQVERHTYITDTP